MPLPALSGRVPVISMWQPFASLVFQWDHERGDYAKCYETRSFKLPVRLVEQWVGIHATAKFPAAKHIGECLNDLCYDMWGCGYNFKLPFGALIGLVRFGEAVLTDAEAHHQCETEIAAGDWSPGRYAWPIIEATRLPTPITMKGKQGWWSVDADALAVPA